MYTGVEGNIQTATCGSAWLETLMKVNGIGL